MKAAGLNRSVEIADPLQREARCIARIDERVVRLKRQQANVTMVIAVELSGYVGLVAAETAEQTYRLSLVHPRAELSLVLGHYETIAALQAACIDWSALTGAALFVEASDGALIRLGAPQRAERRKGMGCALKMRRSRFSRRRKFAQLTLDAPRLGFWREIIARD